MTKKMMKEALLELLERQPSEKITVTDVCREADVNRSTFYAYYEDIDGLFREIEDDILAQLPPPSELSVAGNYPKFLTDLTAFFDYVRRNERLFRIMIVQRDDNEFNRKMVETVIERYHLSRELPSKLQDRYAFLYCINGSVGVAKEWIASGFPISPREIAYLLFRMSAKAIS